MEHLCQLPANLARTELGVRPCVAFLSATHDADALSTALAPSVEETLIPRLDAKEVAAVFTAPFHNFLLASDEHSSASASPEAGIEAAGFPAEWYRGTWTDWHESRWRMHNFYVPVSDQTVTKPKPKHRGSLQEKAADALDGRTRFRVFGMTARILVDAARVAYASEPEFEHNSHFGDEDMIERLLKMGRLSAKRGEKDELTREDLRAAAKI